MDLKYLGQMLILVLQGLWGIKEAPLSLVSATLMTQIGVAILGKKI
jgi:hypothetical protein